MDVSLHDPFWQVLADIVWIYLDKWFGRPISTANNNSNNKNNINCLPSATSDSAETKQTVQRIDDNVQWLVDDLQRQKEAKFNNRST